jgi:hypothetical protein
MRGAYKHWNLEYWSTWGGVSEGVPEEPSVSVGTVRFPDSVRKLWPAGTSLHHIATWYGKIGKQLTKELRKAGVGMNEAANAVGLFNHHGPHDIAYHEWVLENVRTINRRFKKKESRGAAMRAFLKATGKKIQDGVIDPNDFREP